jgi:hypothetical protein
VCNYPIHITQEKSIDSDDYIRVSIDLTIDRNRPKSTDEILIALDSLFSKIRKIYSAI